MSREGTQRKGMAMYLYNVMRYFGFRSLSRGLKRDPASPALPLLRAPRCIAACWTASEVHDRNEAELIRLKADQVSRASTYTGMHTK